MTTRNYGYELERYAEVWGTSCNAMHGIMGTDCNAMRATLGTINYCDENGSVKLPKVSAEALLCEAFFEVAIKAIERHHPHRFDGDQLI